MKETSYEFKPILHDSKEKVEHLKDILIVRIEEPLNFANTGKKINVWLCHLIALY